MRSFVTKLEITTGYYNMPMRYCGSRLPLKRDLNWSLNQYFVLDFSTEFLFNGLQCFDTVGWAAGRASGL